MGTVRVFFGPGDKELENLIRNSHLRRLSLILVIALRYSWHKYIFKNNFNF